MADGKLTQAIQALIPVKPRGRGRFFATTRDSCIRRRPSTLWLPKASQCGTCRTSALWRMWAWLRKRLHALDREDLRRRKPPIGVTALKARIHSVLASHKTRPHCCRIQGDMQGGPGQNRRHGEKPSGTRITPCAYWLECYTANDAAVGRKFDPLVS